MFFVSPVVEPPPLSELLDLLNRDQRTIITINRSSSDVVRFERSSDRCNNHVTIPGDGFNRKFSSSRSRKRFNDVICRLGGVFIVGVCLLTLVRVPAVMSAPSTRHQKDTEQILSHEPTEETQNYLHPCWMSPEEAMNNSYYKMASKETNPDILKNIIILAKNALAYAEDFRDSYVEETFHVRFEHHHRMWENQTYNWLPNESEGIPKRLGHKVDPLHLKSKALDRFLKDIYKYMQTFAVALKQIVIDQERTQGNFGRNFRMMEFHLNNVLCEIREGMMERNILPHEEEVPRSIMKDEDRYVEQASFMNARDWLIFRDLMNCLEYVIEVFTFIDEQSS